MTVKFIVPGEPVAKGRPRFTKSGHAYTPKKTASYENLVRLMYAEKYKGLSFRDDAQLICVIKAYMSVPKSKPKKYKADALSDRIRPTKRPDTDNIIKIVQDALNGVAYHDDAQIVCSRCDKYFSDNPRLEVTIEEA